MLNLTQRLLTLTAGLAFLALPAAAQSVDSSTPTAGAEGTQITITGEGFLPNGKGKPKVWLTQEGTKKKVVLKVESYSDTEIVALLKKGKANKSGDDDYLVTVFPAVKKAEGIVSPQGFRIAGPELNIKGAVEAEPNQEVTLFGNFMGVKKPSVKVGGKGAKVVDFVADVGDPGAEGPLSSFTFLMPKKLANGVYDLLLKTKFGTVEFDNAMQMINSNVNSGGGGSSKASFTFKIDGKSLKAPKDPGPTWLPTVVDTIGVTVIVPGLPLYQFMAVFNYDPTTDGAATLTKANGGIISWTYGSFTLAGGQVNYKLQSGTFDIQSNDNGTLSGVCSATFEKTGGNGPDTVQLTSGKFTLPQQPAP